MKIEDILRIDESIINGDKTYGELTFVIVHHDSKFSIEYMYNSKKDFWCAYVTTFDYDTGRQTIKIHNFDTVEDVIKQIYYISGYYHGFRL